MATNEDIQEEVIRLFDRKVADLPQTDYRDVLENILSDFEARLECVKEELSAEGEDEQ